MIICRTPLRISFFGGGTDFPEWYKNNKGAVISTSIDKYSYITARYLPNIFKYKFRLRYFVTEEVDSLKAIKHSSYREILKRVKLNPNQTVELVHNSDLPAMSGLGSSSSNTVGAINALNLLNKKKLSKKQIAQEAIKIEQDILNEYVGSQDQVVASYGGFNYIRFSKNNFKLSQFKNKNNLMQIEKSLLLIYTGIQRSAQKIEKDKLNRMILNLNYLHSINQITEEAKKLIGSNSFKISEFGTLLSEQWNNKKKLSKFVSIKKIDDMYDIAINSGAYGGKLLGAGSGGFLLFICNPFTKKKIIEKIKNNFNIPIKFEDKGSTILNLE
jgi:D-glycero-alpha-D-manno-heptose-7-phosphate kinase